MYVAESSSLKARFVKKDLETGDITELSSQGDKVRGIAVMKENLLFVEVQNGLKTFPLNGPGIPQQVNTTGLEGCTQFNSLHVVDGTYDVIHSFIRK